ncbi:MAG: TIGR02302 family protein [Alphaproteobacteria bacterium]|nr:TIGR02302 family protein [Alphaproteobacteria bacterium]MBU1549038.1 TIGR02302 family protein [Alphaproteobacteria bacterium]MBU2334886.1 TIGR02302 family protein [Alphaproteobacteria bacterium]MBU2386491.1 TIGR02302 family protein [Alphaproteobacteria bacterium]
MSNTRKGAFDALPVLARRVALKRSLARLVLFLERLTPRLLPPLAVIAVFLSVAWLGIFRTNIDLLRWALAGLFGLAFLSALLPLARTRWPSAGDGDRLLEERNRLEHQPVAVQEDVPAFDTPFAQALWKEHQVRMAERIAALDAGMPRPDIARHDRFALRAIPALLVVVAFGFSFSNGAGRVSDVFRAPAAPSSINPDLRIDAWLTPPSYTSRAPVFLTGGEASASNSISVPQHSDLTVRVTGGRGEEAVVFAAASSETPATLVSEETAARQAASDGTDGTEATTPAAPAPDNQPLAPRTYLMKVAESGALTVNGETWTFDVIPDLPPEIAFDGQPKRAVNGALEIGFTGKDDYGLREAHALIEPVEPPSPDATPLYPPPEFKLDLPRRDLRNPKGLTSRNLTEHPLAGKRVRVTLIATDGAGQTGRSPPHEMVLPGRPFSEPLAAAVAEQRQVFSLDTRQMPHAIALNEVLALRPDETIPNLAHFLLIRSALGRMELARGEEQLKETADYLWEIALGIEDGDLSAAEKRLRDAQNALNEALENGATDEEVARLMQELREAMQEFMSELAQRMQNSPRMQQNMQAENMIRQRDLQNMMDQIENLARSGNRDAAQEMLSELQRMMNNLQAGRMPQGQQGQQQSSQMCEQIDKLGEIMQEQQRLMDETFKLDQALRDRMQRGDPGEQPFEQGQQQQPGQQGQEGQEGAPSDQMTAEQLREALKNLRAQQEGLGQQLQELQKGLAELGMQPGEGFGQAEREMGNAGEALGQGEGEQAVEGQGNALNALRQGAQNMMQQMMQAMQQGQGQGEGQGEAAQGNQNGRDPLGRPRATTGPDFSDQVRVPDEIDVQRAREILEAIRERLGNSISGEAERRYLERLLEIR